MYGKSMDDLGMNVQKFVHDQHEREGQASDGTGAVLGLLAAGYLTQSYVNQRRNGEEATPDAVVGGAWRMFKSDLVRFPLFLLGCFAFTFVVGHLGGW